MAAPGYPRRFRLGPPAGFPGCKSCVYVSAGSSLQCVTCAQATLTAVAATACQVCDQDVPVGSSCSNWLCRQQNRRIDRIRAIAVYSEPLRGKILKLKYDGKIGWARIFGRLLFGYIEKHVDPDDGALIVANPTYIGHGSNSIVQHTELVIDTAETEDVFDEWTWDAVTPRILSKVGPTPKSAASGFAGKRESAEALVQMLSLSSPSAIDGRRVIIYDDVCTTGLQLNAVAGFLLDHGAASVDAIVLARAPWQY